MPQKPNIIATKAISSDVLIFDSERRIKNNKVKTEMTLKGHKRGYVQLRIECNSTNRRGQSYGVSWNPQKAGHIISAGEDGLVCLWDVEGKPTNGKLEPIVKFKSHNGVIEDVSWHLMHETLFASVGDDKLLAM
jgi:histone-binding protein RBBP4